MGGVNDEPLWLPGLAGQVCKNAVEDTHPAPANKPVIQGLMRTIVLGRIPPAKSVPDHKNDPAHNTRGTPCESGKYGLILSSCSSDNHSKSVMAGPPAKPLNLI